MKRRFRVTRANFSVPYCWKKRQFRLFQLDASKLDAMEFYPPQSYVDWEIPLNDEGKVLSDIYGSAEFDTYLHWLADTLPGRTDLLTENQASYLHGMEALARASKYKTEAQAAEMVMFWISEWPLVEDNRIDCHTWRKLADVSYDEFANSLGKKASRMLWHPYILHGDKTARKGLRVWDKPEDEDNAERFYLLTERMYEQMRRESFERAAVPYACDRLDVGYRGIFAHCLGKIPDHGARFHALKFFCGNYIDNMYK